ncbi:hypothetical protein [Endomicrobium proavitum]|uniref:Uncharacterized protein n=1 Tax=Endomicrobium proavitum TaxID=1408281 RepID=A0A0G3WKJ3_9BACT|nr:hypothetical protein [Endomicrobium proavitum]AKL97969.1 exported protein of unknown function [Endomicrobium proavitum]
MFKKILFLLLFMCAFVTFAHSQYAYTVNIGRDVYGAFSDFIPGGTFNWTNQVSSDVGGDKLSSWSGNGNTGSQGGDGYEGAYWFRITGGANGGGVSFSSNQDMSEYYGGTYEFYVKADSAQNLVGTQIGFTAGGNRVVTFDWLETNGYLPAGWQDDAWHKVILPLDSTVFTGLTATSLQSVQYVLFAWSVGGGTVLVDNVLWKKPGAPTTGETTTLSVVMKEREDQSLSTSSVITWKNINSQNIPTGFQVADQYIELEFSDFNPADSWYLMVYTDVTSPSSSIVYTGPSADIAGPPSYPFNGVIPKNSGMVSENGQKIAPMLWSIKKVYYPTSQNDNVDLLWDAGWYGMMDKTSTLFSTTYGAANPAIGWSSAQGFKWRWYDNQFEANSVSWSSVFSVHLGKKLFLYFAVDMGLTSMANYVCNTITLDFIIE